MPEMNDEFFARDAEFGENHLHGGENGVVAATGAPADFLVGLEVFLGVNGQGGGGHFISPQKFKGWRLQTVAQMQLLEPG